MAQAKNKEEFIKRWEEYINSLEKLRFSLPIKSEDEDIKFRIARERLGYCIDELKNTVVKTVADYSY